MENNLHRSLCSWTVLSNMPDSIKKMQKSLLLKLQITYESCSSWGTSLLVWSLGYIFSQACKSFSQAAAQAQVRGSVPRWELWLPRLWSHPTAAARAAGDLHTPRTCPSCSAARLGLVSTLAGRGTSDALHGTVNTLSRSVLALCLQLWHVSESGLHPLGERLFAPRSGFGKVLCWEEEEGKGAQGWRVCKGNSVLCLTSSKAPCSQLGASGNTSLTPWCCQVGVFQQG